MEPKFMISEVFGTSWKYTKSQIWVLVGLFIGYFILSSIISLFGMRAQGSMVGKIIVNLISAVILTDCSGYLSGYPPAILFCLYRRGRLRNYRITAKKLGLD